MKIKFFAILLGCSLLLASCGSKEFTAQNSNASISVHGSKITVNDVKYNYNTMFDDNADFIDLCATENAFIGITKNRADGTTKVIKSVAGTVWTDNTPDYFADSEIDPSSLTYLKIFPLSDQSFLISTDGTLVTLTSCVKCTSAKKVVDFEVRDAVLNGTMLNIIGENESHEINLSEMRQTNIQKDAAFELVSNGAYLVDVRDEADFNSGSINGAINVPLDTFEEWISSKSKDETFILFCQKGVKSEKALEIALENGYEKSYLAGSIDNLR